MLRKLRLDDLPYIIAIEQQTQLVPWTAEAFKICFSRDYYGWVLEIEQKIVGFIIVVVHGEECHIMNLAVLSNYQRQGWGTSLLTHALQTAQKNGARFAYLEVARSNTRAIGLYEKLGFYQVGERKGYYPVLQGREDALVLAKELAPC